MRHTASPPDISADLSMLSCQVEYWMEQLCSLPKLQLPTDFARKAGHGCSRGGWLDIDVPEDVVRAWRALRPNLARPCTWCCCPLCSCCWRPAAARMT